MKKMIKENVKLQRTIVVLAVALIFLSANVCAIDFYDGPVKVSIIQTEIRFDSENVMVESNYKFENTGNKAEEIELRFGSYGVLNDKFLTIEPRKSETVNVKAIFPKSELKNSLNIDSEVLLNGKIPSERVGNFEVKVYLQNLRQKIMGGNLEFTKTEKAENVYSYSTSNTYPKMISFNWLDEDIKLRAFRNVNQPDGDENLLKLEVEIENYGQTEISNIEIRDSFLDSNYKPYEPKDEFSFISLPNEPYYKWLKKIDNLGPGEKRIFEYSLYVTNGENLKLNPLRIFVNGQFVHSLDGREIILRKNTLSTADRNIIAAKSLSTNPLRNTDAIEAYSSGPSVGYNIKDIEDEISKNEKAINIYVMAIIVLIVITLFIGYMLYVYVKKRRGFEIGLK